MSPQIIRKRQSVPSSNVKLLNDRCQMTSKIFFTISPGNINKNAPYIQIKNVKISNVGKVHDRRQK